jgi:hypothetical protein
MLNAMARKVYRDKQKFQDWMLKRTVQMAKATPARLSSTQELIAT